MNESLKIKNFLGLKRVDVDIKEINILIGPQASGKSLVAKLAYFFRNTSKIFLDGVREEITKRELDKKILTDFERSFPRYSWDGGGFEISYTIGEINILMVGRKNAKGKTSLSINYSEQLIRFFSSRKKVFRKKVEEIKEQRKNRNMASVEMHAFFEGIWEPLRNDEPYMFFSESIFIPSSRTFFANLQKNIFTFLASNLDIDPFLKSFGSLYENAKRWYKDDYFSRNHKSLLAELDRIMESVVKGAYEYSDEQDWIVTKERRINLANASSGQQESLPMLLVLCVWPILYRNMKGNMIFIEEPEAHLFPTSQGAVVSMISLLRGVMEERFFITTHSPYILSAFNNLIIAEDAVSKGKIDKDTFVALNGPSVPIPFGEVSAYTIAGGQSKSISDPEYGIIGGEVLDEISEHFERVMNKLMR